LINEKFSIGLIVGIKPHISPLISYYGRMNFAPLCLHSIVYPEVLAKDLQSKMNHILSKRNNVKES